MSETTEETFTEKVEAEARPVEKPAGSPDLVPFKAVPRRKRAEMMRAFDQVTSIQGRLDELQVDTEDESEPNTSLAPKRAAVVFDLLADCEDMLVFAAHDEVAYREWAATADDGDLMSLFNWYVSRFQVGE